MAAKSLYNRIDRLLGRFYLMVARRILNPIYVLGDSHCMVFKTLTMNLRSLPCYWDVTMISGATVSGLKNPNSKTKSFRIFDEFKSRVPEGSRVILQFGEVDVGFLVWYRIENEGMRLEDSLVLVLDKYRDLLRSFKCFDTVVVSIPLPTVTQYVGDDEISNYRKSISASISDRTRLSLKFNRMLRNICDEEGALFVDLDPFSLDSAGRVRKELKSTIQNDHHYDQAEYATIIPVEQLIGHFR